MGTQYNTNLFVLDNHCHVSFPQPIEESYEGYVYWFRQLGISEAGLLSCPVSSHNETGMDVLENMKILYLKDRFSFPTYAYFGFTEHWDDPEKYAQFANTMLAMGFDGLKSLEEHPHDRKKLGKGLTHPSFSNFFALLDQNQVPGVFHAGDPRPNWSEETAYTAAKELGRLYGPDFLSLDELYDEMEQVIIKYSNIRFIMAHFYFISDNYDRACRLLEDNPNLHFDLTPGGEMFINFSKAPEKWREFFIRYRHRILMGSDHYALGYGNSRYHLARNYLEGTEPFTYMGSTVIPLNLPREILEDIYCNNAKLAEYKPNKMRVVGVVDPNPIRVEAMRTKYDIPQENCYLDFEAFLTREKFADAVINGTMDQLHVSTSVPILEKGYDLLLEKPFCTNEEELWILRDAAQRSGRTVMVYHVLRYAPFYREIKKQILSGELGQIISILLAEHVTYHHFGVSYIRGKWAKESVCGAPLLLAKSCHNIDLMMWLKGGTKPVSVASFGSDFRFRPENKPADAGHHCFLDCPKAIEETCQFSARMNNLEPRRRWRQYVYCNLEGGEYTYETCKQSLMSPDNPFSRCVWDCEHDVVDHQTVIVNFADGVTGTFTLVGASPKAERSIHIIGTKGELKGVFEDNTFVVRKVDPDKIYQETLYDAAVRANMDGEFGDHGGGDLRLCEDFIDILQGGEPSISCTSLEDSLYSHLTVFRAEKARKNGTIEKVMQTGSKQAIPSATV